MNDIIKSKVDEILNTCSNGRVTCRESSELEFKQSFNKNSRSKYMKTMAAFANNSGGIILFGIKDKPREIIGIKKESFDSFEVELFTEHLNNFFQPEIHWESRIFEHEGKKLGCIYTFKSTNKPVIATKSESETKISPGDIFYRYRGQTRKIGYSELNQIITEKIDLERKMWMAHLEKIFKTGSTNIGIIDYTQGSFTDPTGNEILIDKKLLQQILKDKKLKFIKEGSFSETEGQPALKLIGEINFSETTEVQVPDLDPDIKYPYLQKELAEELSIKPYDVQALVWELKLKGQKKYHIEVQTSKSGAVHKFSELALDYLKENLKTCDLEAIKRSYNSRSK